MNDQDQAREVVVRMPTDWIIHWMGVETACLLGLVCMLWLLREDLKTLATWLWQHVWELLTIALIAAGCAGLAYLSPVGIWFIAAVALILLAFFSGACVVWRSEELRARRAQTDAQQSVTSILDNASQRMDRS